jgi:hypothetical protein
MSYVNIRFATGAEQKCLVGGTVQDYVESADSPITGLKNFEDITLLKSSKLEPGT